ncbi:MAG: hypothetical protein RR865_04620 [Clostridia bacterium]
MRSNNIRIIALLAMLLCFAFVPAETKAATISMSLFDTQLFDGSEEILSAVEYDDGLLVLTSKAFYVYNKQTQELLYIQDAHNVHNAYADDRYAVDILYFAQDGIRGLNSQTGQTFAVKVANERILLQPSVQLEWDAFQEGEAPWIYCEVPEYVFASNGLLYIKHKNDDAKNDLFQFDLSTGKKTKFTTTFLQGMTPYADGKFIAIHIDSEKNEERYPEVVIFDPVTDTIAATDYVFPETNLSGHLPIYYDLANDRLYAATPSELYLLSRNEEPMLVQCFVSPIGFDPITAQALQGFDDGKMMMMTGANVSIMDVQSMEEYDAITLKIAGYLPDQLAAAKALWETPGVVLEDTWYDDPNTLLTQLLTGSTQNDILVLDSSSIDIRAILQKGYAANLSKSQELSSFCDNLFPALREMSHHDHQAHAIPIAISVSLPTANVKALEHIGQSIPRTMPELVELVQLYADELYDKYPDYALFVFADYKRHLKEYACKIYIESKMISGDLVVLDPAELSPMLQSIDNLDLEELNLPKKIDPDDEPYYFADETRASEILIMLESEYSLKDFAANNFATMPFSLPLNVHEKNAVRANAVMIVIPAKSTNAEQAVRFLEAYIKYMDKGMVAMLCPTTAVPMVNPQYDSTLQEYTEYIDQYKKLAEKATDADARSYSYEANHWEEEKARFESNGKFVFNEEHLKINKSIMEQVYFDTSENLDIRNDLVTSNLITRLLDGIITVEQFAQELNRKAKAIFCEMK